MSMSLVLGSPELNTAFQVWPYWCWVERVDHLPQPASNTPPCAAWILLAFLATSSHCCWLIFNLMSTQVLLCQAGQPLACTGAWGCSSPGAGLCISPCWTSWDSCQPSSPACWGPSGWQHNPLVYRPSFPGLCHQQPCRGCTLPHHPDH